MVKFKINGKTYKAKTKWSEVDPDKLMMCDGIKDELKCLTDVPHETIDSATELQLFPLYTLISFIDDVEENIDEPYINFWDKIKSFVGIKKTKAIDIEQAPYKTLELAKVNLKTGKSYAKILKAGRIYYPDEKNPVLLLGLGANIINQIAVFLEKYSEMIQSEPDADEVWAGVESLSDFGAWGTAYNLAGEDILKLQSVLELPALRVYEALRYNYRKSQYQKRLFDLKNKTK